MTIKRLYIATAPPGVWSSGPSVIFDAPEVGLNTDNETVKQYQQMNWTVEGPFILHDAAPTEDFQQGYEAAVEDSLEHLTASQAFWAAADSLRERFGRR